MYARLEYTTYTISPPHVLGQSGRHISEPKKEKERKHDHTPALSILPFQETIHPYPPYAKLHKVHLQSLNPNPSHTMQHYQGKQT